MSCRVKYFETVYSKAGVGKTSAIRMKEDLLFLPVGGKNEDNKSLMTVDNVYNWAKNIEKKVDEEFNNIKGQDGLKIYGKLLNLVKVNTGPRPGVQIIINYPVDLHKALELKNKQISEQEYINYYKNNNITEKENDQLKLFQLSAQPKSQIKPGVEELFESNPELASIGTAEQYSQYLDTIFPDSKVKDIVYHFTSKESKEKILKEGFKVNKPFENDISFSKDDRWKSESRPETISVIVNIKNPTTKSDRYGMAEQKVERPEIDGGDIKTSDTHRAIVVFNPKQIYILGNKQDIERFKEFVDKTPQQTLFQLQPEQNVNYILKIVNALDKVNRNKFETSKLQGWLNDLQKQGAPTQQLDLFKEVAKDGMTKDEIAAAILANYSYTVEINTAKEKYQTQLTLYGDANEEKYEYNGYEYIFDYDLNGQERFRKRKLDSKQFEKISDKEYLENSELANIKNTQYYSNLTVNEDFYKNNPDWEYKEQRITIPLITPSIKGHAQFAKANDIGWFRAWYNKKTGEVHVLEVQSDLFQKGRDKEDLITAEEFESPNDVQYQHIETGELITGEDLFYGGYTEQEKSKYKIKPFDNKQNKNTSENQFLQLLNKDNNWVTFFVKSIIQDSAKKGYEKVLFPRLDTIIQIESAGSYKSYADAEKAMKDENWYKKDKELKEKLEEARKELKNKKEEVAKIKSNLNYDKTLDYDTPIKNLERLVSEAYEKWHALQPTLLNTAKFYENDITNILKKQGYNPVLITDEYGNTWNEVKIKPEQLNTILLQLKPEQTDSKEIIEQIDKNLNDYIKNNNINIEFKNQVLDSNGNDVVAFYDGVKKVIEINEGKRDSKTLPEELAHHLHLALGKDHILVKRAFNLLNRVDYKAMLGQEYVDLYKNNTDLLKFEILGKLTAAAVRGEKIPLQMNTVEGNKLWDTIKRMIDAVIKLFKPDANVQKELDNLSNQFADILKSGVKIDSESALKFKLYQFNQNNFDIKTDFIMSPNNFKLLDEGKKTVTLRNTNYPSGIYKFGENYYKVHNKFNEPVYLNDVQDSDLKKKFIGSEEIIKDYVDAFFKNEEKMYVYYIEKLDDVTQKLIKDQVESNRQALINIDINVKAAYVYYNKLLKKLKKDNLNYPNPNNPIRKSNEQKIKDIDLALKELTRLDNIQPLINLVNITLDEIDSYINRLDLILNNGGKPNFSNVSSTLATLNKLIDFPTTEKTAAELRRRLNVYLQMAVKEETDRLTGRDNKYDELFGLQEDISTAKKNFGTLVDIKNLLGRSLGLLIKESQNNIERDNSEIYNLIKEKTDNLEKWAKSENINLQKAYDILQQEYRGTYVLTKPYTSDFYKLINDSFDKPNGHEIRKKIATFDNNTKEFIPLNKKYVNSNYTKIQNTPALKEYYEFFKATTKNVSDNILPLNLSDNFIPNIYQKTLIDIFNTEEALNEKTKKAVQHILDFNIFEKMTDDKKYLFDESLMEGDLDLKYLKNLPTDVKSKDLSYNLLKFMYFANSYNHMSEVLEKAKVFLEVSKNVKFIKSNDPTLSIQGDKSSTYDMMQSFFDMQVLGKLKKEQKIEVLGYNFNYGNLFDLLTGFTSLLRLGLNPFNAIANVLTGTVGNIIEATGGRYFNIADYIKARKIFAEMVIDTDSKLYKLIYKINPLQELDDYENLKKIGIGTAKYWEKVKSIMFSPQRFGEFNLQTTPMIAIMLHTDVDIIKNGKVVGKTKMWDAFNEDGEWDTAKMGYELSDFELNRLTNKIHRVNQMIHGRYSSKDASILSQDVFFRMAFQFKKWIPAAIESRLGAEQYDERLDDTVKGRWRSYGPFIKYYMGGLWSKAIGDAKALENNKPLSDIDKYNMYKNAVELVIAAGILLLTKGIEDEEDKKKAWYKLTMRQLNQLSGDLLYFYNPKEMSESAFGGVAAAKTIKDIARTVNYIPYAFADKNNQKAYYRSGKRKHENKFWAGMLDITPGAKSITESVRLFKGDVPYTKPVD